MSRSPYVSVDLRVKIKGRPRELEKEANVEVASSAVPPESSRCVVGGNFNANVEASKRRVQNQSFQWLTLHCKHSCPSLLVTNCEGHSFELYVLVSFLFVFMPERVCVCVTYQSVTRKSRSFIT